MLESDVRATMLYFSTNPIVQYFLSILTGKALPKQQPLFKSNAATQLLSSVAFLSFGVVGSFIVVNYFPIYLIFLLSVTWLFAVAGARKLQAEIQHQIVHFRYSGNERVDRIISDILTTVLVIQDFVAYKRDHQNHHSTELATAKDPDASFLYFLGFKPGMSKSDLWKQLFVTLFTPKFYLIFLGFRLKANFVNAPKYRVLLSVIWLTVLTIFAITFGITNLVLVWVIPIFVLYSISALLQFGTEHFWHLVKHENETKKAHLAKLTVGRFFGEVYPRNGSNFAKTAWLFRMVFYHGIARLFVCPGTLVCHDTHHRMPGTWDWANMIFVRQNDIDSGCKGWEDYNETWGLFNMIDGIFEHLASLSPIEETETISSTSLKEVVLGM